MELARFSQFFACVCSTALSIVCIEPVLKPLFYLIGHVSSSVHMELVQHAAFSIEGL